MSAPAPLNPLSTSSLPHKNYPITECHNHETTEKVKQFIDNTQGNTVFAVADLAILDILTLSERVTQVVFFDNSSEVETFWNLVGPAIVKYSRTEFIKWLKETISYECSYSFEHVKMCLEKLQREVCKEDGWLHSDEAYCLVKTKLSKKDAFTFKKIDFFDTTVVIELLTTLPKASISLFYISNIFSYAFESIAAVQGFYKSYRAVVKHSPDAVFVEMDHHDQKQDQSVYYPLSRYQPTFAFHNLSQNLIPPSEVLPILLNEGASPKRLLGESNQNPLHTCFDAESVQFLVARKVPVNGVTSEGITPLVRAAAFGYPLLIKPLMENGGDPTICDQAGYNTALTLSENGHFAELEIVLKKFPKLAKGVNKKNKMTPLHVAKNRETVELLLHYGASLSVADEHGFTPLHIYAFYGRQECSDAFLKADAKNLHLTAKNSVGETPQQIALKKQSWDLAKRKKALLA